MEIPDISPNCKYPHYRYLLWQNYAIPFLVSGKNCPILAISVQMREIMPCDCLFLPPSSKSCWAFKPRWGCLHYRYLRFVNSFLFCSVRSVRIEENAPSKGPHSICINYFSCACQAWTRDESQLLSLRQNWKFLCNGKINQSRVCSTRRNRARLENLENLA